VQSHRGGRERRQTGPRIEEPWPGRGLIEKPARAALPRWSACSLIVAGFTLYVVTIIEIYNVKPGWSACSVVAAPRRSPSSRRACLPRCRA
jgi:hypothetical protein